MLRSMTGYARAAAEGPWQELTWELRSVNHRYLDLSLYLPEDFRELEPEIRARLGARLARGKLTAQLRFVPTQGGGRMEPDAGQLEAINQALEAVKKTIADVTRPDALQVLRWPGVLAEEKLDRKALKEPVLQSLDEAIDGMLAAREAEGSRLNELLVTRCDALLGWVKQVRENLPQVRDEWRARLEKRVAELAASDAVQADPARLEQELVMIAQRQDIDEELDRLDGHIVEVRDTLSRKEPVGRRLDFLMQELNREANTLTSKSQSQAITQIAVEMKVTIEQMREQVQNVE
ncbi:MAG: YicC/YloC family endoribonuclease [Nevskiales bacterium]